MQSIPVPMVQWIWRQIGVRLPETWEMLQFSTESGRGRCAFADRHRYRFELAWNEVPGEPDYDRMLSDYIGKLEHDRKLEGASRISHAGWFGFAGTTPEGLSSRFGRYLAPNGCLVECVFLWPVARDAALEQAILSSIAAVTPDEAGLQRWRAFGLDVHIPSSAAIEACSAQPARARLSFANPKTGNNWSFERFGMVEAWLKGDVETWLAGYLGPRVSESRTRRARHRGVDTVFVEAAFKPEGLHLRKGTLLAEASICPVDGRLYVAVVRRRSMIAPESHPMERLWTPAPDFTPRWSP